MSKLPTVSAITGDLLPALRQNGIEALLPSHIKPETFARMAAVAIFNNPMLYDADQTSVVNGLIMSARDGLVCDGREAALVPFKTKVNGQYVTKAQYMPMVDGVLKRVRQSGQVKVIDSKAIFANDDFDFWSDEEGDHFKHKPTLGEPGELVAVIAFAKMNDDTNYISLLRRWEIDRSREASKQGNNEFGPWSKYFDRMACKTGLHRIARRLPNSSEILEMLEHGDPKVWDENQRQEKELNPQKKLPKTASDLNAMFSQNETESGDNNQGLSKFDELKALMNETDNLEDLFSIGEAVNEAYKAQEIGNEEQQELRTIFQKKKNSF